MATILCDLSGNPVIDGQGKIVMVSGMTEVRQRINNLFNTQLGSEFFYQEYGFDYLGLIRQNSNVSDEILYLNAVECLHNNNIRDVADIQDLVAYVTGQTGFIGFTVVDNTHKSSYSQIQLEVQ